MSFLVHSQHCCTLNFQFHMQAHMHQCKSMIILCKLILCTVYIIVNSDKCTYIYIYTFSCTLTLLQRVCVPVIETREGDVWFIFFYYTVQCNVLCCFLNGIWQPLQNCRNLTQLLFHFWVREWDIWCISLQMFLILFDLVLKL